SDERLQRVRADRLARGRGGRQGRAALEETLLTRDPALVEELLDVGSERRVFGAERGEPRAPGVTFEVHRAVQVGEERLPALAAQLRHRRRLTARPTAGSTGGDEGAPSPLAAAPSPST